MSGQNSSKATPGAPPAHDWTAREHVRALPFGWEVRAFSASDPRRAYFVPRGLWHVQLWHPRTRVSVLTPSRLTANRFEVSFEAGERPARACFSRWLDVARFLRNGDAEPPPCVCVAEVIAEEVDALVDRWTFGIPRLTTFRGGRA